MAIQIKRGTDSFDPSTSAVILQAGQPFYSKYNKQLYVGDGSKLQDTNPVGAANLISGSYPATTEGLNAKTPKMDVLADDNPVSENFNYNRIFEGKMNPRDGALPIDTTDIKEAGIVVFGLGNTAQGRNNFIAGTRNYSKENENTTLGQGNYNAGKYSLVSGANNLLFNDGSYTQLFGSKNRVENIRTSFVSGHNHDVMNGEYNTVIGNRGIQFDNKNYLTVIGQYNGTITQDNSVNDGRYHTIVFANGQSDSARHNVLTLPLYSGNEAIDWTKLNSSLEVSSNLRVKNDLSVTGNISVTGSKISAGSAGISCANMSLIALNCYNSTSQKHDKVIMYDSGTGTHMFYGTATNAYNDSDGSSIKTNYAKKTYVQQEIKDELSQLAYSPSFDPTTEYPSSIVQIDGKINVLYSTFPVISVAGKQGEVILNKSDVGLSNVDNTSDATKKANFTGAIIPSSAGFVIGGDVYNALSETESRCKGYTDDRIEALDYSSSGSTTKTITSLSQTDGQIAATYSNIQFPVTSVDGKTGAVTIDRTATPTYNSNACFTAGGAYTELNKKLDIAIDTDFNDDDVNYNGTKKQFYKLLSIGVANGDYALNATTVFGYILCSLIAPKTGKVSISGINTSNPSSTTGIKVTNAYGQDIDFTVNWNGNVGQYTFKLFGGAIAE